MQLCSLALLSRGIVLGRTFVNKSDWGVNNCSRSCHQSQVLSCCHWSGMCVCVNWLVRFKWYYWLLGCCSRSQSWLVSFDPLVMFSYSILLICYVNVINFLFVWCLQLIVDICYQKSVYDSKQAYCNKINCCLDGGNTKLRMASSSSNCIKFTNNYFADWSNIHWWRWFVEWSPQGSGSMYKKWKHAFHILWTLLPL